MKRSTFCNAVPCTKLLVAAVFLLSVSTTNKLSAQEVPLLDWARAISGSGSAYAIGSSIATDIDGNVYTIGRFTETMDFDPGAGIFNLTSAGSRDVFISKLDANGSFVWVKSVGSTGNDEGRSIAVDGAGNIVVYGVFQNTIDVDPGVGTSLLSANTGNTSCFILKLGSDGSFIWGRSFNANNNNNYEYDRLIATDAAGNVFVTGGFYGTGDFDPSAGVFNLTADGAEVFIVKLDTNGNFVWAKQVGGTNNEFGRSLTLDATGNVYITGNHHATSDYDPGPAVVNIPTGYNSIFILKLDTNGNFVFVKGFLADAAGRALPYTTIVDPSGNIFTIGIFSSTVDFDPGVGVFNLTEVGGYDDVFISKLDPNGNFVWAKSFGDVSNCGGNSIASDATGNIYGIGKFINATVDFDPGPGVENLTAGAGGYETFILKLDVSGNMVWAKSVGGANNDVGTSISISPSLNIYTTGHFDGTPASPSDFDPTACVVNLDGKMFVQKLSLGATPSPTVTSFSPASGSPGTTVTITGTNFSTTPANNIVTFNGTTATVTASTTTSITTTVPAGTTTGKISVTINCITVTSATDFTVSAGSINITIQPQNFPACPGDIATFTTAASGANNIAYHWQIEFDGTFTDITNGNGYSGVNTSTFAINTNQNNGIGIFRCRITGDGASEVFTNEVSITLKFDCEAGNEPPIIEPTATALQAGGVVTIDLTSLISDPDDNLDLSTLQLVSGVSEQGASASLNGLELILNYNGVVFLGTDHVSLEVCDLEEECVEQQLTIEVGGDIIVYNAISPNGDAKNEVFLIQYLDALPSASKNRVSIFNRWGDLVFEVRNYNNTDRVFKGIGKNGNDLPSGTYYYKIEFTSGLKTQTGYLSLKR